MGREMSFISATATQQNHCGPAGPDWVQKTLELCKSKSISVQMLKCALERCAWIFYLTLKEQRRLLLVDVFLSHAQVSASVCMASPAQSDLLKAVLL